MPTLSDDRSLWDVIRGAITDTAQGVSDVVKILDATDEILGGTRAGRRDGRNALARFDTLYPGTTPWERLGLSDPTAGASATRNAATAALSTQEGIARAQISARLREHAGTLAMGFLTEQYKANYGDEDFIQAADDIITSIGGKGFPGVRAHRMMAHDSEGNWMENYSARGMDEHRSIASAVYHLQQQGKGQFLNNQLIRGYYDARLADIEIAMDNRDTARMIAIVQQQRQTVEETIKLNPGYQSTIMKEWKGLDLLVGEGPTKMPELYAHAIRLMPLVLGGARALGDVSRALRSLIGGGGRASEVYSTSSSTPLPGGGFSSETLRNYTPK